VSSGLPTELERRFSTPSRLDVAAAKPLSFFRQFSLLIGVKPMKWGSDGFIQQIFRKQLMVYPMSGYRGSVGFWIFLHR